MENISSKDLERKIGQMLIIGFDGIAVDENSLIVQHIKKQQIGGVILFDYYPDGRIKNIINPNQLKRLTTDLRGYAKDTLFISIDYEGGTLQRLTPENGFPPTLSQYQIAKLSENDAREEFESMAALLQQSGINLNFSPVVDLHDPENPIIGQRERAFSHDPNVVKRFAQIAIQAYNLHGILVAIKHFPGHGYAKSDSHLGFVDITDSWHTKELLPYECLINEDKHLANHALVMTGHLVQRDLDPNGYPASLSYEITTALLRDKIGFNGVIITDDLQMSAITDKFSLVDTIILAINAGADMLLFGNSLVPHFQDPREVIEIVKQAIVEKKIKLERIESSFLRIQRLKNFFSHH